MYQNHLILIQKIEFGVQSNPVNIDTKGAIESVRTY